MMNKLEELKIEDIIDHIDARELLGLTKEEMEKFILENELTKVRYDDSFYHYALYKDEVLKYMKK